MSSTRSRTIHFASRLQATQHPAKEQIKEITYPVFPVTGIVTVRLAVECFHHLDSGTGDHDGCRRVLVFLYKLLRDSRVENPLRTV